MTLSEAKRLKSKYELILVGKPIGEDSPGYLIGDIEVKEMFPYNYEVVLVAYIEEGIDKIYRTLRVYLDNNTGF